MSQWLRRTTRWAFYVRDGASLDGACCVWCNRLTRDPTMDHLVPRSLGGTNHATNLVTSCRGCNGQRTTQSWEDWRDSGNYDPVVGSRIDRLRFTPLTRAHRLEGAHLARTAPWFVGQPLPSVVDDTPYEPWD